MSYLPIEDYGLIGNMRTSALVGRNGSIDWLCWPHVDSPSVFARILDDDIGGHFQIAPDPDHVTKRQVYWPDTNVLITRFLAEGGVAEVIDYMPVGLSDDHPQQRALIRRVEMIRGALPLRVVCQPAFDYARASHRARETSEGVLFASDDLTLELSASVPLTTDDGAARTRLNLRAGERAAFVLREANASPAPISCEAEGALLDQTLTYWRSWLSQSTYTGRWREQVHRSALALKLLTFEPTGAIVAAPTMGLPEAVGGVRNWDYRYTWLRDAAFTVYGLLRIGFTEEAAAFMEWLADRCRASDDGTLNILYDVRGGTDLTETTLDHLDGYRGSSPVRRGNAATDQLQLDIYGEVMDAVYLSNKYHAPIAYDFWTDLQQVVSQVCERWAEPDDGIWEVRSGREQFTYSKLMCWVALDRALRLADKRSFPADRQQWRDCRDAIYQSVMEQGWSEERQAFVQHFGSQALDASLLTMPLVFFMAPNDPRMTRTLDAMLQDPSDGGLVSDSLVYRYDQARVDDGLPGEEGSFNMCTFWMVEALARAGRTNPKRLDRARLMFEKMLGYANHLGLFAEETGARGEALGNFPQGFTHLALISAAFNLDRTLEGRLYGTGQSG
ncbi:glycoside hydrolase family 15 protein [Salisaeta longa]|uniref:glycoside hydrolase family 15 protein n=1 Tax=Salisaeta longa TaxID=503170 RepID=UPI0003B37049|nr:glycoside hydrolase family 15 protein [Salisaeta longa]